MSKNRIARLNSLLKEVLSEVIHQEVKNPHVHRLVSVTSVTISKDLRHAKVLVSIIGTDAERTKTIKALQSAAGFIAIQASKQVVMCYFPQLKFQLDTSADKQVRVDFLLNQIHQKQQSRCYDETSSG